MSPENDARFMAACLRYARRHRGLTGTNPSVGTLIVTDDLCVVGAGVTAKGGRPHAEPLALEIAGERARGATAYVSLEPCAHHGVTRPCAQTLIDAGVRRVVTAWVDPDQRVNGKGHAMLRAADIEVDEGICGDIAKADLSGYLNRKSNNRPQVILKLAVSADGKLGLPGQEIAITGELARNYGHRMRAEYDAILVGRGTVEADDPDLTCRLNGLNKRSPHRFVLDCKAQMNVDSRLANSAHAVPVTCITGVDRLPLELQQKNVRHLIAQMHDGALALPEILEDMAALGISSLLVEGGRAVARSFLDHDLIDDIALFTGSNHIGDEGIVSPITKDTVPDHFRPTRNLALGQDRLNLYRRK